MIAANVASIGRRRSDGKYDSTESGTPLPPRRLKALDELAERRMTVSVSPSSPSSSTVWRGQASATRTSGRETEMHGRPRSPPFPATRPHRGTPKHLAPSRYASLSVRATHRRLRASKSSPSARAIQLARPGRCESRARTTAVLSAPVSPDIFASLVAWTCRIASASASKTASA